MRPSLVRTASLIAVGLVAATPALAQRRDEYVECFRDGRRVSCDDSRSERDRERDRARDRERERALERAREARERAAEARDRALERAAETRARALERIRDAQRDAQWRRDEERRRQQERMLDARRSLELSRERARLVRRRYYDDTRPRLSLGGGVDMRRFEDANRYLVHGAVDFRSRSGIGIRPEVVYGWTDPQHDLLSTVLSTSTTPTSSSPIEFTSRSKMLGVNLNGTYSLLRRSWIRPYVLGGIGVFTTRETVPQIASTVAVPGSSTLTQVTYRAATNDRVDVGLNAGSGLEFGIGPVHLYTEFRYFLNDRSTARGFSGMMPITAGLRF